MTTLEEAYDFFLFLEEMFTVTYRLGDPDQIEVEGVKVEFWDKVVSPRLPPWVRFVEHQIHETRIISLRELPFSIQITLAANIARRKEGA